jgi:hypothetical protein
VIVTINGRVWPTYNANGGQGKAMHYDCSAYSLFALRAPQGQLTARQSFFRMINKIIKEGYQGREKIKDAAAASYTQTQRDLETFRNPATGETMELSSLYGHAWVNDKGEYLLPDHAGFDPNAVFKDSKWTAMEQVKK